MPCPSTALAGGLFASETLRQSRSILLALGWYYPEIHRGVLRFARDHHWHVTADFDDPIPKDWTGDGVITILGAKKDLWKRLQLLGVPMVDLAESRPSIKIPRVTMDNKAIGRMAAEHFLAKGHRRFAFVHRWELGVSRCRRRQFISVVRNAGFPCHLLSWHRESRGRQDTPQQRHLWLMEQLSALPKPLAVFASRDTEAVEVIEACLDAGIKVPEQIAVLGVDNTEQVCESLRVPLSSVDPSFEQIGFQGASLLNRLMQGESVDSTAYVAPTGIVERRSTDHLAVGHPAVAAALRFMHSRFHEAINMTDIVRHVAISRSGLEKAFRDHFIRPPIEELRHVRLSHARKMLRETDEKILSIAMKSGFCTAHNLCRVFRQHVGMTPKQYRLKHRQAD